MQGSDPDAHDHHLRPFAFGLHPGDTLFRGGNKQTIFRLIRFVIKLRAPLAPKPEAYVATSTERSRVGSAYPPRRFDREGLRDLIPEYFPYKSFVLKDLGNYPPNSMIPQDGGEGVPVLTG